MPALTTQQCYQNADRLRGRTVVITGAAAGFGRACALDFAKHGANLVLGDVDDAGLTETVRLVEKAGGRAVSGHCDVTKWDEQAALFARGQAEFGAIHVVLPNAGINEIGCIDHRREVPATAGPTPPNLATLNVDLVGVLFSVRLALWYFDKHPSDGLRAIAFTGSMSTFYGAVYGPMYGAAKAGVLGIQKGIYHSCEELGVRLATICPYFVNFVHPNPRQGFAQIEDVVAAFVAGITDPDTRTTSAAYLIPDDKGVYRMDATGQFTGAERARRIKPGSGAKL